MPPKKITRTARGEAGPLRIALPTNDRIYEDTLGFLAMCGLRVRRSNPRQYVGSLDGLADVEVRFQRSVNISAALDEGTVDVAILGRDRYQEDRDERGDTVALIEDLGYSRARLGMAAPSSWGAGATMAGVAKQSAAMAKQGRMLRVATEFPRQVGKFLDSRKVKNYRLVVFKGGIESAPAFGTADVVGDLVSSGTTLRENNLVEVMDGTILQSAACLVAQKRTLAQSQAKQEKARELLELIDARQRAEGFYHIIANIRGESMESVATRVTASPDVAGMQGPTVAQVVSKTGEQGWYSVSVVVPIARLTKGVDHMRAIGGSGVIVLPVQYVFASRSESFARLEQALGALR